MNIRKLRAMASALAVSAIVGAGGLSSAAMAAAPVVTTVRTQSLDGDTANRNAYQSLRQSAVEAGKIRVLVGLDDHGDSGAEGDRRGTQAQRIAASQQRVLANLRRDSASPEVLRYASIPFMAMSVGAAELDALVADPGVRSVSVDRRRQRHLAQSVPLIGGTQAFGSGITGSGQVVAVVDDGVYTGHPFLQGKVVDEACFVSRLDNSLIGDCPNGFARMAGPGSGVPNCDDCTHGTHVAGIVAGLTLGSSGVAKGASVLSARVLGEFGGLDSDILAGLEWVYGMRQRYAIAAVNMSLGSDETYGTIHCDPELPAYKAMFDNLRNAGIATIVSSGNDGHRGKISAPACVSTAVAVGATDKLDMIASYSNHAGIVDLMAPGSAISSSVFEGGGYTFASWNGTSMAAPHVAGAWAVFRQAQPHMGPDAILDRFVQSGVSVSTLVNGASLAKPRINVASALGSALDMSADGSGRRKLSAAALNGAGQSVATTAGFAMGIGGGTVLGTGGTYTASTPLNVSATVNVAPTDVGSTGTVHVVAYYVDAGGSYGWFVLTPAGWQGWDTNPQTIPSVDGGGRTLQAVETISIAQNMVGMVGTFAVYVGYKAGSVLHYSSTPLSFVINP
ncbi:MAG: S8 family serine peptidase [Rhodocyclales bacterium]|nr:S8 family serine peptidase [Rhodocyclales bacterium]